ncbi:MAG: single-stranded DNA-binding protein [Muribaculaceae bacterium]|nr:single-stranded DNA-binding protein [Muribaculaceae bacterium]
MSVNKAILLGYVGNDPEIRYPEKDKPVASLSLATKEVTKNGVEVTEWHKLVFWGETAQIVERYVRKGTQLYVEGKISTREYQDRLKITRQRTEIIVSFFEIVGRRNDNNINS